MTKGLKVSAAVEKMGQGHVLHIEAFGALYPDELKFGEGELDGLARKLADEIRRKLEKAIPVAMKKGPKK